MGRKLGATLSETARKNVADAVRRRLAWRSVSKLCEKCGGEYKTTIGKENSKKRKYCSKTCAYMSSKRSEILSKNRLGQNNPNWKGGVTPINHAFRMSAKYRDWRESVFIRDDYTCQECFQRGGKLNADHIKTFAHYPELRLEISNGRTLCEDCHRKTPNYGSRANIKAMAELV